MFAIDGNFSTGVYTNNMINGFKTAIMQSQENADTVISDFEKMFQAGLNPNAVLQDIMDNHNFTDADFTENDIVRVNRKVESIYKSKNKGAFYK